MSHDITWMLAIYNFGLQVDAKLSRQNYDQLLFEHGCDVKTMINYFLNMVMTSKLRSIIFFNTAGKRVFNHMYSVKVYYK